MKDKSRKVCIISFIFILIANISINLLDLSSEDELNNNIVNSLDDIKKFIKPSWENSVYHITGDNWSVAISKGWCTGSGTESDPYIIENLNVNCQDQYTGIEIENSTAYFIIQDCQIDNIGSAGSYDKGIYLRNASNGIIRRNSFTTNSNLQYGIRLDTDSDNNFISENLVNNFFQGIYLYNLCDNNTIFNNHINGSTQFGIAIQGSTHYFNNISSNLVHDISSTSGIEIQDSFNSTIERNIVYHVEGIYGIRVTTSNYTEVINNVVYNNTWVGISLDSYQSKGGLIANNYVYNISDDGIRVEGHCKEIQVIQNTIKDNGGNAIYVYADDVEITRNTIINHPGAEVIYLQLNTDNASIYDNYILGTYITPADNGGIGDNHWNSSSVGNYWEGSGGTDSDLNGIRDTSYSIDGTATSFDYLPVFGDPFYNGSIVYVNGSISNGYASWSWVASRAWCLGTGTYSDPYIIEDIIVNANANDYGIRIDDSEYFEIQNCTVYGAKGAGINITESSNATISACNISFNDADSVVYGIYLQLTPDAVIKDSHIEGNTEYGIRLSTCDKSTIKKNKIVNNPYGLTVSNCDFNIIINNIINATFSTAMGIGNSDNCSILNNQITDNPNTGLYVYNVESTNITGNTFGNNGAGGYSLYMDQLNYYNYIYNNRFEYTPMGPVHENLPTNYNYYNNSEMGNYWFDYSGNDTDDDGIGDQPYDIHGAPPGVDYRPLWDDKIDVNGGVIYINDTDNSNNWASVKKYIWCSGSGTEEDPYILGPKSQARLTINGSYTNSCISIVDSERHFIIEDCLLGFSNETYSSDYWAGIHMNNVTNGVIKNNLIYNNCIGIYAKDVDNLVIENNQIENSTSSHGMYSNGGLNHIFRNNNISDCDGYGYWLWGTSNVQIYGNQITGNFGYGIALTGSSFGEVYNNFVEGNNQAGIATSVAQNITIRNNIVYKNTDHGISVSNSGNSTISFNNITENSYNGVYILRATADNFENNKILNNTIYNNNRTGIYIDGSSTNHIDNLTVSGNNISYNGGGTTIERYKCGIYATDYCFNLTISENRISNNTEHGIFLYQEVEGSYIANNKVTYHYKNGIYLSDAFDYNQITENTLNHNIKNGLELINTNRVNINQNSLLNNSQNGIYLFESHNCTITGNTANDNLQNGITLINSTYNNISENLDTLTNNGLNGVYLEGSDNNTIYNNNINGNQYGVYLNNSNYNNISYNDLTGNNIGEFIEDNCIINNIHDNILDTNGGNGKEEDDDDDTAPPEAPADFMIFIIIGVIIGAVVIVGGIVAKGKKPSETKLMKEIRDLEIKETEITEKQELKVKVKPKKAVPAPAPALPKEPKKAKREIEFEEKPLSLSQEELKELQKTEAEVGVEKKKIICIVHKGPIVGDIYLCPVCQTFYCVKCAKTLKARGEKCWSCESEIETTTPSADITTESTKPVSEIDKQAQIKKYEAFIQQTQATIQKLDVKFSAGTISQEDFIEKKNFLAEKLGEAMARLEQLKE